MCTTVLRILALLCKMSLHYQVCSAIHIMLVCYLSIVSVASMFSPDSSRLYEDFKKFNGSYMLSNSKFHFNYTHNR